MDFISELSGLDLSKNISRDGTLWQRSGLDLGQDYF